MALPELDSPSRVHFKIGAISPYRRHSQSNTPKRKKPKNISAREVLASIFNTFRRTYGTAYCIMIAPKLIKLLIKAKNGTFLSTLNAVTALLWERLADPFPKFLLVLFGGFQILELIFQRINKKTRKYFNYLPNQKSKKRAVALAAFVSSAIAFQYIGKTKKSEVALFALVRAGDIMISKKSAPKWVKDSISVILFQLSTWQIMYSWFFYPETLPNSYNQWISKMAHLDPALHKFLYDRHKGVVEVGNGVVAPDGIKQLVQRIRGSTDLPVTMPLECMYAHEGIDGCLNHKKFLWSRGFKDSMKIYAPLNLISFILRLKTLTLQNFVPRIGKTLLSAAQSSSFLASFITVIWSVICFSRNTFNRFDGPIGPALGTFFCGFSILIEIPSRRHQLALYCLPKAIDSFLGINIPARIMEKYAKQIPIIQTLAFSSSLSFMLRNYRMDVGSVSPTVRTLFRFFLSTNENEVAGLLQNEK